MLLIGMGFGFEIYIFRPSHPEAHILLYLGVLFHGYATISFVTGQLYVDKAAPDDIRSSAQGFIAFVTLGAGMCVGGILNGWWNRKIVEGYWIGQVYGISLQPWKLHYNLPCYI